MRYCRRRCGAVRHVMNGAYAVMTTDATDGANLRGNAMVLGHGGAWGPRGGPGASVAAARPGANPRFGLPPAPPLRIRPFARRYGLRPTLP